MAKRQIEKIRSLLGDSEALFLYIKSLPRPLDPIVREYLSSQVGVMGSMGEVQIQYRIRGENGLFSNGGGWTGSRQGDFNEKGRIWPTVKSLMRELRTFPAFYQGCSVVTEYTVTLVVPLAEDKTGDPKALKRRLIGREEWRTQRPLTKIPSKELKVGSVYRSKGGKIAVFRGWTHGWGPNSDFIRVMVFTRLFSDEKPFQDQYKPRCWVTQQSHSFTEEVGTIDLGDESLPLVHTAGEVNTRTEEEPIASRHFSSW